MRPEPDDRTLAELTREAREEPTPDVDWDAIEKRLPMTRVATVPPRALNVRPWLYAATFVLGAGGLGLAFASHSGTTPPVAPASASASDGAAARAHPSDLNGDALALGAVVTSGDLPQSVVHAGHARWTLGPHSAATLLASGELVNVRLDRGTITSRVTKSSRAETFAVEAADVRVAAHGTEFVVTLGADGVSVSVTDGAVVVGLRDQPATERLEASPVARRYSLRGFPLDDARPAPSASPPVPPAPAAELPAKHAAAPARPAAAPLVDESAAPEQPSPAGLERTAKAVSSLTQTCFKARTTAGEGVRVTAQSTVTFRTEPRGALSSVEFEPPLAPSVQACVRGGLPAIRAEATQHGFQLSRAVELER